MRLRCIRNRLGEPDQSGRRRPDPIPGSEFEIEVDLVIDAVGEAVDPAGLTSDPDEQALLRPLDIWGRTAIEGVWVGGDFTGGERTVAHAIGSGKRTALAIDRQLRGGNGVPLDTFLFGGNGSVTVSGYINGVSNGYDRLNPVEFTDLNLAYHPHIRRSRSRELSPESRTDNFSEVVSGLTVRSVVREAGRCFHCGTCDRCGNCHVFCPDGAVRRDPGNGELSFDLEHCKGCGVCASECPRAVIEMVK